MDKGISVIWEFNTKIGIKNQIKIIGRYGENIYDDNQGRLIDICESTSVKTLNRFCILEN